MKNKDCSQTYFMPLVFFYAKPKTSENQKLPDVFRGLKRDRWHEIGYEAVIQHTFWRIANRQSVAGSLLTPLNTVLVQHPALGIFLPFICVIIRVYIDDKTNNTTLFWIYGLNKNNEIDTKNAAMLFIKTISHWFEHHHILCCQRQNVKRKTL